MSTWFLHLLTAISNGVSFLQIASHTCKTKKMKRNKQCAMYGIYPFVLRTGISSKTTGKIMSLWRLKIMKELEYISLSNIHVYTYVLLFVSDKHYIYCVLYFLWFF